MADPATILAASAYLVAAVAGVVLTVVDVRTHRLPNRIVLPALIVTIALLAASCAFGAPWAALVRALGAGTALFVFFVLLRVAGRGAIGGGDVKLAALVGVLLGWVGWSAVLLGVVAAFLAAGVVAIVLLAARRATSSTRIPFGPFLVIGTWIGVLADLV
ncbi:A24 family peptidase [uncultured Microbacterium sp.]|uniref:prepilin peptidase n=1 Tax=uncultured Microbacterium sp. TaxID=191216 RepID=UPI0025F68C57|nr:A24 family peptidase [uncultured Microbacterium sp.]